jgi:hypothetical protein
MTTPPALLEIAGAIPPEPYYALLINPFIDISPSVA